MSLNAQDVLRVLEMVPIFYRGPGGAVAVLKDGELVSQHVWGYADMEKRIPVTPDTLIPICSITKQFICALLIDLERNPTPGMIGKGDVKKQLFEKLKEWLPKEVTHDSGLTIDNLCDMQSGIRDYWAMTTLWGAKPDDRFTLNDAKSILSRIKSFHFEPGTQSSYSNVNFYLLGRLIEEVAGESLENLLAERIFGPAKMKTARLRPDTSQLPPPCVGYEGIEQDGFIPAKNFIEWSGDAGIVASLTDMIAYEKYFDSRWLDPQDPYREAVEAGTFKDGGPARYRYGLGHVNIGKMETVGHGGALRGFRLRRLYAKHERISVVVMFNHEAEAGEASAWVLRKIFDQFDSTVSSVAPAKNWFGSFLDKDTQLAVIVRPGRTGRISISFAGYPESVGVVAADRAESRDMSAKIDGNSLHIRRLPDNLIINATRIHQNDTDPESSSLRGSYHCSEMDSTFHCEGSGDMLYGSFDGPLGKGAANLMRRVGGNVWFLACPRGLDAPAPGDWTLVFHCEGNGAIVSVTIGCWLSRRLEYRRM